MLTYLRTKTCWDDTAAEQAVQNGIVCNRVCAVVVYGHHTGVCKIPGMSANYAHTRVSFRRAFLPSPT